MQCGLKLELIPRVHVVSIQLKLHITIKYSDIELYGDKTNEYSSAREFAGEKCSMRASYNDYELMFANVLLSPSMQPYMFWSVVEFSPSRNGLGGQNWAMRALPHQRSLVTACFDCYEKHKL